VSQAGLEHLLKEIRATPLTVVVNWLPDFGAYPVHRLGLDFGEDEQPIVPTRRAAVRITPSFNWGRSQV